MKKLFMLLAIAGVMVACADDKKKDEKKDAQATEAPAPAAGEQKDAPAPAASNVDALINKAITAIQNNDEAAFDALQADFEKLSAEDQAKFEAAVMAAMGM